VFLEHVLDVPSWRQQWAGVVDPSELPCIVLLVTGIKVIDIRYI
jgi:hypothetical protein